MTRSSRRFGALACVLVAAPLLALLAACASPAATPTPDAELTLENCGVQVTFAEPPQRVVAIKSTSTEMMLALGVGDRIIGTAFQDGPVPEQWAADAANLTSISDFMPSEEAVLDLEPDLVYSGWESAFAADTPMTWSTFAWESVVDADPDVIVLIDATWNTAASKIELLQSNPATAALSAVQNDRYIILAFASSEAGVRTVSAATSVAEQLAELDLP